MECCYGAGLIVKTNNGLIKGKFMATKNGKLFASFTGIPYAEPPIGPLRFLVCIILFVLTNQIICNLFTIFS